MGNKKEKFTRSNCKSGNEPLSWGKMKIQVGSEEFLVQVGVHQGSVLSPLLFAITVDVILENAREGLVNEILYVDDVVLISESMENLKEKFLKWK